MNRSLDGTLHTIEDLSAIALNEGLVTEESLEQMRGQFDKANALRSHLGEITRKARFRMMGEGRLRLDTRTEATCPGFTEPVRKGA